MLGSTEARTALPSLHVVTDDVVLAGPRFAERAEALLAACGPAVALHLRGPRTGGRVLHGLADGLTAAARAHGSRLIVNDRVDVARAVGADGVQLPARGLPVADARRLLGGSALIGASVHDAASAAAAAEAGAGFLLLGTLYASRSHPGRSGVGAGAVRPLAGMGPPVIGIGGITPARVPEVLAAGAHGVAVLSGVWRARSPADAALHLVETIGRWRDEHQ